MFRKTRAWSLGLAAFLLTTAIAQGQAPSDGKVNDARIDRAILETINLGVPLYNAGDHYGCYRLYQGLAMGLRTSGREGLPAIIEAGMARAEAQSRYDLRAAALRLSLDQARALISGGASGMAAKKPLWDRLGGERAVTAVVHDFVALAATDPRVDFTRGGKYSPDAAGVAHIERTLVELVSAVSGGPLRYTGRPMKPLHAGMGITDAQFNAMAADLVSVLGKYRVPKAEADELLAAIASTRKDIVEASPSAVPTGAPSPPLPSASVPPTPANNTLFERLGGRSSIVAVVDDFVNRAAADPKVNFTRKGTAMEWDATPENVKHVKASLAQLVEATTGGPTAYKGPAMKPLHKGMGITKAEFAAIAADLKATLDKFKVPAREQAELFKIIGSTQADIVETP